MDSLQLFEKIGFDRRGIDCYNHFHPRQADPSFRAFLVEAYDAYSRSDVDFGACIAAFAARENLCVEALNLYIYLLKLEKTYEKFREMGIDERVFFDTMSAIPLACDQQCASGTYGMPQRIYRRWFRRFLDGTIFRLGRLQFDIHSCTVDAQLDSVTFSKGDTCLSVHIPSDGSPLTAADCEAAFDQARPFFAKYFGMEQSRFICYSWLLQPWLSQALPAESNIVRFQSGFQILSFHESPGDMLMYVFPKTCTDPADYPENSVLQRATKARLLQELPIGYGTGIRL